MSLVLEMPADTETTTYTDNPALAESQATAQAAADLLDMGEGELEEVVTGVDPHTGEQIVEVVKSNGEQQPEKKNRTRKPKAKPPIAQSAIDELNQEHPFDTCEPIGGPDQNAIQPGQKLEPYIPPPKPPHDPTLDNLPKVPSIGQRAVAIAALEGDCLKCFMAIAEDEAVIESAKGRLKYQREIMAALAVELRELRNSPAWQPRLDLKDGQPSSPTTPVAAVVQPLAAVAPPEPEPTVAVIDTAAANGDGWREVSIDKLGLPPKLAEKLTEDGHDTIGRLESLRAEISQGRAKWPKGIGLAKITIIEDAVIKWLTANRDAAAFGQVSRPAGEQPVNSELANSQVVTQPAADLEGEPWADKPWEDLTNAQQNAYLIHRSKEINNGQENCLDRQHKDSDRFWESGYSEYGQGVPMTECIYVPGVECDDYIRGWLAAKCVDKYEPGPTETKQATTTKAKSPAKAPAPTTLATALTALDEV